MRLREFQRTVDTILPPSSAMHGDAIGIQVESALETVSRVLICLEITDSVVTEAKQGGFDTILTFHPLIYKPLAQLHRTDRVGRCVAECIRSNISVLSVHTTFDTYPQGTNYLLAKALQLDAQRPLVSSEGPDGGMGLVATCSLHFEELCKRVATVCGGPVRYTPPSENAVFTVAIVGGSGMSFFDDAVASGADVFITADVKYHGFHAASGVIGLIDPGHFEMEQFVPAGLCSLLQPVMPQLAFQTSNVATNPVQYFVPNPLLTTITSHP